MERTTRMGMSVVDAVKEIQARDSIFVAYSGDKASLCDLRRRDL